MAITFNPSSLTMRVGFKQTVAVTSTTPITSIASVDARILTVAGATGSTTASVVITPVNGSYGVGKLRIGNSGGELVDLNVTVLGIDTTFVAGMIGIASSDIGTLCQGLVGTVQKINRWSYRKPVRRTLPGGLTLTDAHILAAKYGLSPAAFTTYGNSSGIQFTGLAPWDYLCPLASVNPFSIDDFAGYNGQAIAPLMPPIEVVWNIADGSEMPVISIPYKYSNSKYYQGGATAAQMALMECVLEKIITNPTEYYLCAIYHGYNPYVMVANAIENLAQTHAGDADPSSPSQAGTIDLRPFSLSYWLSNDFDIETGLNGKLHILHLALNHITGRALGKVMRLSSLDARTTGDFNTNNSSVDYNGYHNNEFLNMPLGEVVVNWYTFYLNSWMYSMHDDVIIRLGANSTPGYVPITLHPNIDNEFSDATMDSYYANNLGFSELIMKCTIINNGASMTINGKTLYRGYEGPVVFNMIPQEDRSTSIATISGSQRKAHYAMPRGWCWKSGNGMSKIYTIVQTPLMTHGLTKRVYLGDGSYLGQISAITSTTQFTYSGVEYYRSATDDIAHFSPAQPSYNDGQEIYRNFGVREIGSSGFNTQLTINPGEVKELEFHLYCGEMLGDLFSGYRGEEHNYIFKMIYNSHPAEEIPATADQYQDTYRYSKTS